MARVQRGGLGKSAVHKGNRPFCHLVGYLGVTSSQGEFSKENGEEVEEVFIDSLQD